MSEPQSQAVTEPVEKQPYIGSVRFFKHCFLGFFIMLVIIPTVTSIVLGIRTSRGEAAQEELHAQLEATRQELAAAQQQLEERQLAIDALPYTSLYPDFYAPEVEYSSLAPENVCYLTFDDGPSRRTQEVLDILGRENVKATFFVVKNDSAFCREQLKRAADEGHTIGLHSTSHDYEKIYASVEAFLEDYYKLYTWVYEVTGQKPSVFRFPGGSLNSYNRAVYQEIIAEMNRRGFVYFDWNVSSGDASGSSPVPAARIVSNCLSDIPYCTRAIVLMHDSGAKTTTVDALPDIIAGTRSMGYTFDRLSAEVVPVSFGYAE